MNTRCARPGGRRPFYDRLLMVTTAMAIALPAAAQEAEDNVSNIEELIVTARKREETVYELPSSLSTFSNDTLRDLNAGNLDDIGKYVPNLNINRFGVGNPSQAAIFIRGIGLQDHLIVTDPGVGLYLDGVYLGRQQGANLTLQNIERIEVLRGPQGTLYGRNSLGGAVNVILRKPGAENTVEIDVRAGSRERFEGSFYANVALSDTFGISFNGGLKRRAGVGTAVNLDNPEAEIGEEFEINGRIAGLWQVTDTFTVEFSVDGVQGENGQSPYEIEILTPEELIATTGSPIPGGAGLIFPPGDPLASQAHITPDDLVARDDLATSIQGLETTSNSGFGASLTLDWAISERFNAKVLAAYRAQDYTGGLDDDDTILNLSEFPEEGEAEQISVELQLNADFGKLDAVGGFFYFREEGSVFSGPFTFAPFNPFSIPFVDPTLTTAGTLDGGDFFEQAQTTNSFAGYLSFSYEVSDKLRIGVGGRFTSDQKDASALFPSFGGVTDFESATFDAFTADGNITYLFNDQVSVYAQIQRGYQTGGFPPRPFGGPDIFEPFDEQTALNYEVGFKGQITPEIRVLASAFWTMYDDLALSISVPGLGGGFTTIVENVGESRSRGIELEANVALQNGFFANAALGLLDSEITEVTPPVDGSVLLISAGDEPALTPTITASLVLGYVHDLADAGSLKIQGDFSYRGDMFGQPVNTAPEIIEDRSIFGFNAAYLSRDESWSVSIYGENVGNAVYDQGRLINTFHGFVGVVLSNDRSEFGVRFTKKFFGG